MHQAGDVKFATIACVELHFRLILLHQRGGWPEIDNAVQLVIAELVLQLVSDGTQSLVLDRCGRQLVLVVHEIEIENRNGFEFCAERMGNPQDSAQYGGTNKPPRRFGNDGTRAHRDRSCLARC